MFACHSASQQVVPVSGCHHADTLYLLLVAHTLRGPGNPPASKGQRWARAVADGDWVGE